MALDFRLPRFRLALAQNPRPRSAHLLRLLEASLLSFFQTHVVRNKGTCRFYYIAAAAGPRRRPARTGRGDRRRCGLRHRPGERRQVGRLSAPHALLGAPTQSPAAAPPLANLISSRYLVMSPLPIDYPGSRAMTGVSRPAPRSASRADLPILRGALAGEAANAPAPDAVELSTRCSLARSGRLRAALRSAICQSNGQPKICSAAAAAPAHGHTAVAEEHVMGPRRWRRGAAASHRRHHPAQAPGAPGPRPPLERPRARPHIRNRRDRRAQESVLFTGRV